MIHCALVLMASLPTGWLVVGIVLGVLTVVSLLLCAFKWREAAMLKKEVFELRDTIRMMRYEEANLSRMLHTADKSGEEAEMHFVEVSAGNESDVQAPVAEMLVSEELIAEEPVIEEPVAEEPVAEEPVNEESLVEENNVVEENAAVETEPSEPVTEEQSAEEESIADEPIVEVAAAEVSVVEETMVEEPAVEPPTVVPVSIVEEPVAPKPRKQAINERRPAIPNDLFAAWFEENEPLEPKKPAVEPVAKKEEPASTKNESVKEELVEAPTTEDPGADTPIVAAIPEESVEERIAAQPTADAALEEKAPVEMSKEDERFCRKLERIVNARMRNPNLNIDVIASQFGMGRTNFYRKVRELMDMSPNDYLRKCRMERAAELLQSTDMNVTDVCTQVGMPDAQYFSRVFKTYFGMPPSAYREK